MRCLVLGLAHILGSNTSILNLMDLAFTYVGSMLNLISSVPQMFDEMCRENLGYVRNRCEMYARKEVPIHGFVNRVY
ncbi:hypothetical protein Patl1_29063 [Pistacia atlantica]|uniref:Uncharacterized protein n=1 Tax=Pistacia atlantica TaxID=434234 RepID=A0ACC1BCF3_9ROSI|nr:hypothetical protein Patl1_29063 [Pistacia atlantica]